MLTRFVGPGLVVALLVNLGRWVAARPLDESAPANGLRSGAGT